MTIKHNTGQKGVLLLWAGLLLMVFQLGSCGRLHEDLDPCPQGFRIRFIYEYNMEFANAFPSQVDCLTVLFYDSEGRYVTSRTNTSGELSDEFWRMEVDLAPGLYTIVAYGGLECSDTSFSFVSQPPSTPLRDIRVQLNPSNLTSPVGRQLHHLFYGRLEASVAPNSIDYREVTVRMMKDTNNLRIVLQQAGGQRIDNGDFTFRLLDNNTHFGWDNELLPSPQVTYYPWTRGNAIPGELPNGTDASVAWAEFSFPRLVVGNSPQLVITSRDTGKKVVDIPLNNYLLLLKSQQYSEMGSQEYLDRESRWHMIFFLGENNTWIRTSIVINDWVVRLNEGGL